MGNFSYLLENEQYKSFAPACVKAEDAFASSTIAAMMMTRRAMELATKWIFTVDQDLELPYRDNVATLLRSRDFVDILDPSIPPLLNYIRKIGNLASHSNVKISREESITALHYLFQYTQWIDYVYGDDFVSRKFDEARVPGSIKMKTSEPPIVTESLIQETTNDNDKPLTILRQETPEDTKQEYTVKRKEVETSTDCSFEVEKIDEAETRKRIIDIDLRIAGWKLNENVELERKVFGMPNKAGDGFVDYVLLGKNGLPLAVVEAKKTMRDPNVGREQARIYAELLVKETGQFPLIFYTNGFETWMIEDDYPPRRVSGFYTQDELQRVIDRRKIKEPLANVANIINEEISGRYYQKEAIVNVAESFDNNRRKTLLVMATGTGKTRTAISLVDVLTRKNWVKNVLFLADRNSLVKQAHKAFKDLLPEFSITNLVENKDNPHLIRGVFSTYPTMMNVIDSLRVEEDRMFSVGHFDLIIIDEAHRSIYKKYQAIFDYFDSLIVGLTATPREDIEMSTYDFFDLENGVPTYAYDLKEAVEDGYLVPYRTIETELKIPSDGIKYDDLSSEEKEAFDDVFGDEPEIRDIDSSAINTWLFNKPTIDYVLKELMEKGIKDSSGDEVGKTIIFAKNHRHAEAIKERFDKLFPKKGSRYAEVIDYSINYYQNLIDHFSVKENKPQIAISVDMLDTGIDVPEVVNLVFFKKVRSKIKFWQMIGRGTRLCVDLFGPGQDKQEFLIFDYGLNFEFFGADGNVKDAKVTKSLTQRLFETKLDLIRELQNIQYQEEPYPAFRKSLVDELHNQVLALDEESFQVRMSLRLVLKYKNKESWENLEILEGQKMKEQLGGLVVAESNDELARRFDLLMFTIELAMITDRNPGPAISTVMQSAKSLEKVANVPAVYAARKLIRDVQDLDFWQNLSLDKLEEVRIVLRELVKFIEREQQKLYFTNFQDEVLAIREDSSPLLDVNDLRSYREKVEHYIKNNLDNIAVFKLRHNKALTPADVGNLENVLFSQLGTREQYEKDFGDKSIARLVREIAGMDREAVNEAFSKFLSDESLNSKQIIFLRLIVDYIVENGYLEKIELTRDPFKSVGGIVELFGENRSRLAEIISSIDAINDLEVG